jgi:DNA-binding CsgD family transcriptional regulator
MNEVRSAFYWRENMALQAPPRSPAGTRRKKSQVAALREQIVRMAASGMSQRRIAASVGVTRKYVQDLVKDHRCRQGRTVEETLALMHAAQQLQNGGMRSVDIAKQLKISHRYAAELCNGKRRARHWCTKK